jgi:hypothetical protein
MPLTIPWLWIVRQDSSKLCTDNPEVGCVLLVGFHDVVSIWEVGRNWTDLVYGIESDKNEFQYWMLRPSRLGRSIGLDIGMQLICAALMKHGVAIGEV